MKSKRIILGFGLLLVGSLMLSSCTKNDDNTIVLIGRETPKYGIQDIISVIPEKIKLFDLKMILYLFAAEKIYLFEQTTSFLIFPEEVDQDICAL